MERRLSAILSADVVGYSRLMGANEVATLETLNHRRSEVLEPAVARHGGRVFKFTGDGMLAEFPSVVGAVEGALAIQSGMLAANADVPDDRRIDLRIGIHVGDVIPQDGDLFGDGVNLAARIEGIARPGRIAVSQAVRDHVGNRLDVEFEDRGDQDLKNIDRPVRIFEIASEPAGRSEAGKRAEAGKPSIAVLPFNNMSGDPDQEFFSDGISEDLITDLSKISGLFVVGRHTSFAYKGQSERLDAVARELGVRYLLEGSVRKAGNRVRITGQLIDGVNGGHVWAERYDRDLTDIFAIQDEITKAIVDQLKVRLMPEERQVIGQVPTPNVEAYTLFLQGRYYFHNPTKAFLRLARIMFVRATELDPSFARAYAGIANCDARLVGWYGEKIPLDDILAMAGKALALDPKVAEAHAAQGEALRVGGRSDEAVAAFEQALAIDPNSYEANLAYARLCRAIGRLEDAADFFIRALEIQPDDYQSPILLQSILLALGRHEQADEYGRLGLARAEEALRLHPEGSRPAQLGACVHARAGNREEAIRWIERALCVDPDDAQAQYNVACAWAIINEPDRALDVLEGWAMRGGVLARNWLERDPDLNSIRSSPRYPKLLAMIDQRWAERSTN
jgi:adenylate cyclase